MNEVSPNLKGLTAGLPPKERAEIEASIASSPYLRQIMTEAVNAGSLRQIRLGVPGANEGGSYHSDEKAIYISPDTFTDPTLMSRPERRLDVITSTLGHETGHALYAEKAEKERYAASYAITEGIRSAGQDGEFDATAVVGAYIRSSRRDEALAEIHGWNALASRIEHTNGRPPSQEEMLRRAAATTDCIEGPSENLRLASGILLDADMQMSDQRIPKRGSINLEPVAQCHFDQSRAVLGKGGAANYPNYYGGYLIEQLADDTRGWVQPPSIKLDLAKLGLDKAQLESTGLRLPAEGFSIIDISQGRYRPIVLRSSGSGMQGTPDDPLLASNDPAAHDAPEHRATYATPEQRDAREQAQREANREGLARDDVQQIVQAAAVGASARELNPDALRLGDRGDAVELLQYRLERQGYRGPDGAPIPQTGQYGPETEHAVRQFQTMHGLPASGVADRDTRDAVDHALAAQRERERSDPGGMQRSTHEPVAATHSAGMPAPGSRSRDDALEREAETLTRAEVRPAALAETSFDPAIAHRVATRDERDDERQPSADPNPKQAAVEEQAQQTPVLMTQPGHPAHAMYTQALSQIERGDLVPAGTMTQEEKSRLAAGVVAQFLAEDKFATRIDGLYASKHNAAGPGMPTSLIPVQGDPTTDYCRRASVNVEHAVQTSLAQSSTIAQAATLAREQELTRQQELAQQQDQDGPRGPTMRIGPRTLQQGPQGDGGGGDGGGG